MGNTCARDVAKPDINVSVKKPLIKHIVQNVNEGQIDAADLIDLNSTDTNVVQMRDVEVKHLSSSSLSQHREKSEALESPDEEKEDDVEDSNENNDATLQNNHLQDPEIIAQKYANLQKFDLQQLIIVNPSEVQQHDEVVFTKKMQVHEQLHSVFSILNPLKDTLHLRILEQKIGPDTDKLKYENIPITHWLERHLAIIDGISQPKNKQELISLFKKYPHYYLDVMLSKQTIANIEQICGSEQEVCEVFFCDPEVLARLPKNDELLSTLFPHIYAWERKFRLLKNTGFLSSYENNRDLLIVLHAMLSTKQHYDRLITSPKLFRTWLGYFAKGYPALVTQLISLFIRDQDFCQRIIMKISFEKIADECLYALRNRNANHAIVYELLLQVMLAETDFLKYWLTHSRLSSAQFRALFKKEFGFPTNYLAGLKIVDTADTHEKKSNPVLRRDPYITKLLATIGPDLEVLKRVYEETLKKLKLENRGFTYQACYEYHSNYTNSLKQAFQPDLTISGIYNHIKQHSIYHLDAIFSEKTLHKLYSVFSDARALQEYYLLFFNEKLLAHIINNNLFLQTNIHCIYSWQLIEQYAPNANLDKNPALSKLLHHLLTDQRHFNRLTGRFYELFAWLGFMCKNEEYGLTQVLQNLVKDDRFFNRIFLERSFEQFFAPTYAFTGSLQDKQKIMTLLLEAVFNNQERFMQWIGKSPDSVHEFCKHCQYVPDYYKEMAHSKYAGWYQAPPLKFYNLFWSRPKAIDSAHRHISETQSYRPT